LHLGLPALRKTRLEQSHHVRTLGASPCRRLLPLARTAMPPVPLRLSANGPIRANGQHTVEVPHRQALACVLMC
jgi:hypothetical protein